MDVLDSYIFNPNRKHAINKVTKKAKEVDNIEETVIKEIVLLDDTIIDPIRTILVGIVMFQEINDNIINTSRTIHAY